MLFNMLLREAIDNKQFESTEDLVKSIKSILRKASFPRYKENRSGSEKGFAAPSQYGYKYKYLNGVVTISFFGTEPSWISELARAFKTADINYHYNDKQDIFLIKAQDNVKPLDVMKPDSVDEYENNTFDVIGSIANSKTEIAEVIKSFNTTQKAIYDELVMNGLVEWRMFKQRLGKDVQKFKYKLVPIKIESDK